MIYYRDEIVLNRTSVVVKPDVLSLAKNFWLYAETWQDQCLAGGRCLVFGGIYTVWKIENGVLFLEDKFAKYDPPNSLGLHDVTLVDDEVKPNLKVGDRVTPSDDFNFHEFKKGLSTYYNYYFSKGENQEFTVTGVLNDCYIFIKVDPLSEHSLPFWANDFNLISRKPKGVKPYI